MASAAYQTSIIYQGSQLSIPKLSTLPSPTKKNSRYATDILPGPEYSLY